MEKVRQFFDKYLRAYNERDLYTTVNCFLLPSVMINTNRTDQVQLQRGLGAGIFRSVQIDDRARHGTV